MPPPLSDRLLVVSAPAKINLFLETLSKRPDGYHELITFMAALDLADTLELTEDANRRISLTSNDPALPTGSENLVRQAAELLQQTSGTPRGARIHLTKRIPVAAGLGGGSSDAAAALVALNDLWQLGRPPAELEDLAAQIGSDVPFFIRSGAAWCSGRGEKVKQVELSRPLHVALICPASGLKTADVYRQVVLPATPRSADAMAQALAAGDVDAIGRALFNRLQPAAESLNPDVRRVMQRLEELAPGRCLMSGSGSSCFALGRDANEAAGLAATLHAEGWRTWATRTRTGSATAV